MHDAASARWPDPEDSSADEDVADDGLDESTASRGRRRHEPKNPMRYGPVRMPGMEGLDWHDPTGASMVVRGLHVLYRVGGRRPHIKDLVARGSEAQVQGNTVHAVRGLDFVARPGESIGFIGHNGSGKSTLLRCMAGLLPPTAGEVLAAKQPVLLGVGAALLPDVSGRRNIELGCLALGMSPKEVDARVESIISFAQLQDFIDLPLRTYSSGMRARLHFAIATVVDPDILLIDEALSVGDENFKQRSQRRIEQLIDGAGTVIVVSHSMGMLKQLCSRVVWMDHGRIVMDGPAAHVIRAYRAAVDEQIRQSRA